ncbi:MAG: ankyrin repeat domain-containing protein, partial [Bacteroidales bacterium]
MQDSLDYALMDAAWAGHEDSVLLLLRRGADVNARNDHSQETPLIYASQQGELAVVKILLDFDARPGLRPRNNEPALIRAVTMGYLDVAEELIRHGANVNQTGKLGRSALHYAATFGHY